MINLVKEQLPDSLIATLENCEKNDFEEKLHNISVTLEATFAEKLADKASGWTENTLRMATELAKDYPEYGFDNHVGYGTLQHRQAIFQHGLTPLHRTIFKLDKFCA
jgi:hypothetical protein